jgi:hypothetical protein
MLILSTLNNIFFKYLNPTIAFLSMVGLLIFWIIKKTPVNEKFLKRLFWIVLISIVIQSIYLSAVHILIWNSSPAGKAFLPPTLPWSYSLNYVFYHYCKRNLFTIISALILLFVVKFLNKRFEERFFYPQEPYLMSLGILWSPWPGGIVVFLGVVLITFLIIQIINIFSFKKERISMLYLWLPCSLLSFFITYAILNRIPIINSLFV